MKIADDMTRQFVADAFYVVGIGDSEAILRPVAVPSGTDEAATIKAALDFLYSAPNVLPDTPGPPEGDGWAVPHLFVADDEAALVSRPDGPAVSVPVAAWRGVWNSLWLSDVGQGDMLDLIIPVASSGRDVFRPDFESWSLCDLVHEGHPLPEGWTLRHDDMLASDSGVLLVDQAGDFPHGTYTVMHEHPDGHGFVARELLAEIRTSDPRLAVAAAAAIEQVEP